MKGNLRMVIIEQIIETNFYLTKAIFNNEKRKIEAYKDELDNLIKYILEITDKISN